MDRKGALEEAKDRSIINMNTTYYVMRRRSMYRVCYSLDARDCMAEDGYDVYRKFINGKEFKI